MSCSKCKNYTPLDDKKGKCYIYGEVEASGGCLHKAVCDDCKHYKKKGVAFGKCKVFNELVDKVKWCSEFVRCASVRKSFDNGGFVPKE